MSDPIKIPGGAVTLYQRTTKDARTWTARTKIKGAKGTVVAATRKRDLVEAKGGGHGNGSTNGPPTTDAA